MRITRNGMLMGMAEVVAQRGTCSRLQVGVVIAVDSRIVSMGYNGAAAGMDHCQHECDCNSEFYGNAHTKECASLEACTISVHAEANAVAYAARHGMRIEGGTLYTTHSPCLSCAQLIVNSGLQELHYIHPYRKPDGLDLLHRSGMLIDRYRE